MISTALPETDIPLRGRAAIFSVHGPGPEAGDGDGEGHCCHIERKGGRAVKVITVFAPTLLDPVSCSGNIDARRWWAVASDLSQYCRDRWNKTGRFRMIFCFFVILSLRVSHFEPGMCHATKHTSPSAGGMPLSNSYVLTDRHKYIGERSHTVGLARLPLSAFHHCYTG